MFVGNLLQFILDDGQKQLFVAQDGLQFGHQLPDRFMLLAKGENLKASQALQAQVQDCLGLYIAQSKPGHQGFLGLLDVLGLTDQADDFVQVVHRDNQPFQDVRLLFRLVKLIFGAAGHHFLLVGDVILYCFNQPQLYRAPLGNGYHVDTNG